MKFTKMHGIGNDYICVNCFEETVKDPSRAAKQLGDRHFGIGADGLVLILPSKTYDFQMRIFNADGTEAEASGNASRCVGKYVFDNGLTNKHELMLETKSGIKRLFLAVYRNKVTEVTVDMGRPEARCAAIPVYCQESICVSEPVEVGGREFGITCISMGNPHAIVFRKNVGNMNIGKWGPLFENHPMFPQRVNVEFVEIVNQTTLKLRVWKRGVGETMSSGTGACAAVVAAALNAIVERKDTVTVLLRGGSLNIVWDRNDGRIYMTGGATTVFEGVIPQSF